MVQHKKWNGNDGTFSPWCTNNNSTKKPVPYSIFDALHTKHYHMEIFVSVHFIQVYDLICEKIGIILRLKRETET